MSSSYHLSRFKQEKISRQEKFLELISIYINKNGRSKAALTLNLSPTMHKFEKERSLDKYVRIITK